MSGNPASYRLSIDWTGAGSYPDNGDTAFLRGFKIDRGRENTFTGSFSSAEVSLARQKVGQLTLTLDNSDGRYDAYNKLSPLSPNVTPGKIVQLIVTDDLSNVYYLFTGIVDDIRASGGRADARVEITCSDAWKQLSQRPLPTPLFVNDSWSRVVFTILSNAGVLLSAYQFADVFPYTWGENEIPYEVLHDLVEMEGGYCSIDVYNGFRHIDRWFALIETPVLTLDQSQVLNEPVLSQPWDNLRNYITVAVHDRTAGEQSVIWETPDIITLEPGESFTQEFAWSGANGKNVPTLDDKALGARFSDRWQDDTGVVLDWEQDYISPPGNAATRAVIRFKSKETTRTGYVINFYITGTPLDNLNTTSAIVFDATSMELYGTRVLRLDYPYMQGIITAQAIANYYLARLNQSVPAPLVTVEIVNRSTIQFACDLNAVINFTSSYLLKQNLNKFTMAGSVTASAINSASTGIYNAGFEIGNIGGWSRISTIQLLEFALTTTDKHAGTFSLFLPATFHPPVLSSEYYSALPNTSYTMSFWMNWILNKVGGFVVALLFYDSSKVWISQADITTAAGTTGWEQKTVTATSPAGTAFATIGIVPFDDMGELYLDDFALAGVSFPWINPTFALLDDNSSTHSVSYTQVSPAVALYTDYLKITGFGFSIASSDTVKGVKVRFIKWTAVSPPASPGYVAGSVDYSVRLVKGGALAGSNYAKAGVWNVNPTDSVYGGNNDMWGTTWTPAQINAADFGVAISATNAPCNAAQGWATALIQYVEITVITDNNVAATAFRVIGIKHETGETPYEVKTTWVLEPTINATGVAVTGQTYPTPSGGDLFWGIITY